ncbi:Uncharacterised protein [Mycobacteroides abscessus subsp. abscessus]|uniref:hypothetical protein n=1 Tax=Mycobacteroides abscessus TaxID=36809 RepID=UPI000925D30D|nr:hypothetical protein [Mycobacteroides abscessus]SIM08330.1 Uncharacterised protein [Mycobacteroides abscessus subsp. abscessus]SLH68928.1 Uncharacterised protein [Mycobacteroides abscessus subsp. massiliense]SLI88069.1 Uncharacterised protein [Mycobacteroides abscessus subsp. massiliense]
MNDWKATGQQLGGISRSSVFKLWDTGQLGSVKVLGRRFSTDRQIAEYIANLEARAVSA